MHHLPFATAAIVSILAGPVLAQPDFFADLGEIQPGVSSGFSGVSTPGVTWFRFSIPEG